MRLQCTVFTPGSHTMKKINRNYSCLKNNKPNPEELTDALMNFHFLGEICFAQQQSSVRGIFRLIRNESHNLCRSKARIRLSAQLLFPATSPKSIDIAMNRLCLRQTTGKNQGNSRLSSAIILVRLFCSISVSQYLPRKALCTSLLLHLCSVV